MKAQYKFNANLLKASKSQDLTEAKNEWSVIIKSDQNGLCICQHKLKHIYFMYNSITNLTITVGVTCAKKFGMKKEVMANTVIKSIFTQMLEKGEYEIIDDIIVYTKNVERELITYLEEEYKLKENNIEELKTLLIIIQNIKLYDISQIYERIKNKIDQYIKVLELTTSSGCKCCQYNNTKQINEHYYYNNRNSMMDCEGRCYITTCGVWKKMDNTHNCILQNCNNCTVSYPQYLLKNQCCYKCNHLNDYNK